MPHPYRDPRPPSFSEERFWADLDGALELAFTSPDSAWEIAHFVLQDSKRYGYEAVRLAAEAFMSELFNYFPGVRFINKLLDIVDR